MRRQAGIGVRFLDEILGAGLLRLPGIRGVRRLPVTQRQEAAGLAPPLRPVGKLSLAVGADERQTLPRRRLQLVDKTRGLARHYDVSPLLLFVGFDRLPAVKARVGPRENDLYTCGQPLGHAF